MFEHGVQLRLPPLADHVLLEIFETSVHCFQLDLVQHLFRQWEVFRILFADMHPQQHRILPGGAPQPGQVPGGEAGLRFLSSMTKRPASSIDLETVDDLLEAEVNRSLRQPGLQVSGCYSNPKLAALWKIDLDFRIRAMTGAANRLSYRQICNARLWHACGWSLDKIWARLTGMDDRVVSHDQLQRLLDGKSYQSIPHVLIPFSTEE